ncbi:hypothetical protein KEJ39_03600 [Candidatus Bathyarchaeota archaeon]|nr:hypothetical protein [Candidatus Bathyarchaeota archaeon]
MPRTYNARRAEELTRIVRRLHESASFRNILREAARYGVLKDHKTLRVYLDLLVRGKVLRVRTRDVGSLQPQQIYSFCSDKPKVSVGLAALERYGLNWDVPETEMRVVSTDFEGLVRSKIVDSTLIASLEDCLIHEIYLDARKGTGTTPLVIAILATRRLDLPYLIRRADEMRIGRLLRLLLNRILKLVSSGETMVAAPVFMAVRERFLKLARQYSQSGFWKLVDERGVGDLGLESVEDLTEYDIILAAGKQLGVTG